MFWTEIYKIQNLYFYGARCCRLSDWEIVAILRLEKAREQSWIRAATQLSISDSSCFFIQVMFLVMLPLAFQAIGVQ